jgi:hypothetical protein
MGSVTEAFANLNALLLSEEQAPNVPTTERKREKDLLVTRVLRPYLPASIRMSPGTVVDVKDRQVGPFDIIGGLEQFPAFGDGMASIYPVDGVLFSLHVRDWGVEDLSDFGRLSALLKKLERKAPAPAFCAAVAFGRLGLDELSEFLRGPEGQAIDAVFSVGHHFIVRNRAGWYGDPERIPFVTERQGDLALKAFTFLLMQITHSALGIPFGLAAYQHL